MHSAEIKDALFPQEAIIDKLHMQKETLQNQLDFMRATNKEMSEMCGNYDWLREQGVVLTIEGKGAVYLQGESMDEYFKENPVGDPTIPVGNLKDTTPTTVVPPVAIPKPKRTRKTK